MVTSHETPHTSGKRVPGSRGAWAAAMLLLPGLLTAQVDLAEDDDALRDPAHSPEELVGPSLSEQELAEPSLEDPRNDSHASRQADKELLQTAAREPEQLIGKPLIFEDGTLIGSVLDLRQRRQNEELYVIVDATEFFNTYTEYAVALEDIDRLEEDALVIPEAPGMHLRGFEYYAEDFIDVPALN